MPTTKRTKKSKPVGRPSKYHKRYVGELIKFFNIEPYVEVGKRTTDKKSGREYIDYDWRANDLPTFEHFAFKIGVHVDTMIEWTNAKNKKGNLLHPEFSEAYKKAKQLQKHIIITNGLQGLYQTTFAIFLAKNVTDLRDVREFDHTSKGERFEAAPIVISQIAARTDGSAEE